MLAEMLLKDTPAEMLSMYTPAEMLLKDTPAKILLKDTPAEMLLKDTPTEMLELAHELMHCTILRHRCTKNNFPFLYLTRSVMHRILPSDRFDAVKCSVFSLDKFP